MISRIFSLFLCALLLLHSVCAQSDWTGSGTILDPLGGDLAYQGPPRYGSRHNGYTSYNNNYNRGGYSPYYNYGFFG